MTPERRGQSDMDHLNRSLVRILLKLNPLSVFTAVIILSFLSGGIGTLMTQWVTPTKDSTVHFDTEMKTSFDSLQEGVQTLNTEMRRFNLNLEQVYTSLTITRCEVRALREGFDWRDCWVAEPEFRDNGDI